MGDDLAKIIGQFNSRNREERAANDELNAKKAKFDAVRAAYSAIYESSPQDTSEYPAWCARYATKIIAFASALKAAGYTDRLFEVQPKDARTQLAIGLVRIGLQASVAELTRLLEKFEYRPFGTVMDSWWWMEFNGDPLLEKWIMPWYEDTPLTDSGPVEPPVDPVNQAVEHVAKVKALLLANGIKDIRPLLRLEHSLIGRERPDLEAFRREFNELLVEWHHEQLLGNSEGAPDNALSPDDDHGYCSVEDMASQCEVPSPALRKRLYRYRLKNNNCAEEVRDRKPRQPKWLFKKSVARQIAMDLKASIERPAKKKSSK